MKTTRKNTILLMVVMMLLANGLVGGARLVTDFIAPTVAHADQYACNPSYSYSGGITSIQFSGGQSCSYVQELVYMNVTVSYKDALNHWHIFGSISCTRGNVSGCSTGNATRTIPGSAVSVRICGSGYWVDSHDSNQYDDSAGCSSWNIA